MPRYEDSRESEHVVVPASPSAITDARVVGAVVASDDAWWEGPEAVAAWKSHALELLVEWPCDVMPLAPGVAEAASKVAHDLGLLAAGLRGRLERLRVDVECLDDGAAESLFRTHGRLQLEGRRIVATTALIAQLQTRAATWQERLCAGAEGDELVGLEAFVVESLAAVDDFVSLCTEFTARRRAAVARARATIEVVDSESRLSVSARLTDALRPACHVDFPCVTTICERATECPAEMRGAMLLLASIWAQESSDRRKLLKSLTIANEMIYNEKALSELARIHGALESLWTLQVSRGRTPSACGDHFGDTVATSALADVTGGLGAAGEASIRMLASEVGRRLEATLGSLEESKHRGSFMHIFRHGRNDGYGSSLAAAASPSSTSPWGSSPASWASSSPASLASTPSSWGENPPSAGVGAARQATWHGDGEGPVRGRAGAEVLATRLRRAHAARAIRHWLASAGPVLGDVFATFEGLAAGLAKLHDELDCLDDGSTDAPLKAAMQHIASLLLAATQVQAKARDWQHQTSSSSMAPLGADLNLSSYLKEAVLASDELHKQKCRLSEVRRDAVERAKASIEAAGAPSHSSRGGLGTYAPRLVPRSRLLASPSLGGWRRET